MGFEPTTTASTLLFQGKEVSFELELVGYSCFLLLFTATLYHCLPLLFPRKVIEDMG